MEIRLEPAIRHDERTFNELRDPENAKAIASYPEWKIRERCFLTDVILRIGESVLDRTHVAVVDLGLSLRFALNEVAVSGFAEINFEGSSDRICFTLSDDLVEVRSNYGDQVTTISFVELHRAAAMFMKNVLKVILEEAPAIRENSFLELLCREFGVR